VGIAASPERCGEVKSTCTIVDVKKNIHRTAILIHALSLVLEAAKVGFITVFAKYLG